MPFLTALKQENEILLRVSQGSERAFAMLFHHYHQRLGVHVYRITKSEELAEEIVQDVFMKIWLNRELLTDIDNFPVYLYVISKNAALNCLKKVAREKVRTVDLDLLPDAAYAPETSDEDYRYLLIDEAIDRLPSQQRQVYLLSRHERMTYLEVATRMNISKETVKKYLQIATESISSYIRNRLLASALMIVSYFLSK